MSKLSNFAVLESDWALIRIALNRVSMPVENLEKLPKLDEKIKNQMRELWVDLMKHAP